MQVITGKFRGRKLVSLPQETTRPTLGRAKESIFNLLNNYICGANVLDLFAGSGALGIECISRGANWVTFVDNNKECQKVVGKNLKNDWSGCEFIVADYDLALHKLGKLGKIYNLVLLDPPFDSDYLEKSLYLLHKNGLLDNNAIVMCEMNIKKDLQNYPQRYIIEKQKVYGIIKVDILRYKKD